MNRPRRMGAGAGGGVLGLNDLRQGGRRHGPTLRSLQVDQNTHTDCLPTWTSAGNNTAPMMVRYPRPRVQSGIAFTVCRRWDWTTARMPTTGAPPPGPA